MYRDSFAPSLQIGDDSFSDLYFVIGVLSSVGQPAGLVCVTYYYWINFLNVRIGVMIVLGSVFCDWGFSHPCLCDFIIIIIGSIF